LNIIIQVDLHKTKNFHIIYFFKNNLVN